MRIRKCSAEPDLFQDWGDLLPEFRDIITLPPKLRPKPPEHVAGLIDSVYEQQAVTRSYDPAYVKLAYPGGDVPLENRGVH
ncbi:MAG: hypothetical protein R3E95_18825 [Thiolinea sp.]